MRVTGLRGRAGAAVASAVAVAALTTAAAVVADQTSGSPRAGGPDPAPRASAGDAGPAGRPGPVALPADIDRYDPRDLAFYGRSSWAAATLPRPPKDLDAAVEESTAVVLARITDARPTRRMGAEAPVEFGVYVLDPVMVINGRLRPELGGRVEVEVEVGMNWAPAHLAELRAALPRGLAVWFLRWQGEPPRRPKPNAPPDSTADRTRYTRLHVGTLFVQGPDGVVAALLRNDRELVRDAMAEAERYDRLSDLVGRLSGRPRPPAR